VSTILRFICKSAQTCHPLLGGLFRTGGGLEAEVSPLPTSPAWFGCCKRAALLTLPASPRLFLKKVNSKTRLAPIDKLLHFAYLS
jgi:hypothetical protein